MPIGNNSLTVVPSSSQVDRFSRHRRQLMPNVPPLALFRDFCQRPSLSVLIEFSGGCGACGQPIIILMAREAMDDKLQNGVHKSTIDLLVSIFLGPII